MAQQDATVWWYDQKDIFFSVFPVGLCGQKHTFFQFSSSRLHLPRPSNSGDLHGGTIQTAAWSINDIIAQNLKQNHAVGERAADPNNGNSQTSHDLEEKWWWWDKVQLWRMTGWGTEGDYIEKVMVADIVLKDPSVQAFKRRVEGEGVKMSIRKRRQGKNLARHYHHDDGDQKMGYIMIVHSDPVVCAAAGEKLERLIQQILHPEPAMLPVVDLTSLTYFCDFKGSPTLETR